MLEADPASLHDVSGENLDPHKIWACMMHNEKPGGHGLSLIHISEPTRPY